MENLKTNWKLSEKSKNPRSQQEIGCEEIENILKTAGFILFFLKKIAPLPCQIPESGRKSGHQVGKTALKWLDNTVKSCPKIGWRNCQFSTIQQRKSLWHFLSQTYGGDDQIWTGEWRFCRPLPYHNDRRISVIFRTFARFSYVLITFNIYTIANWYLSTTWWHYYSTYSFILATLSYTRQSFISGM